MEHVGTPLGTRPHMFQLLKHGLKFVESVESAAFLF